MQNKPIVIAENKINPGEYKYLELPAASLFAQTPIKIPVHIIHGREKGHRLFVMAAIHGDEVNGVEIIRRLLSQSILKKLHGTLIAVPVANIYGFISLTRYLPDRRDLNRAFPGLKHGSLTARLANLFMEEIIKKCTHGIDLHTGNVHSEDIPHLRANLDVPGVLNMAKSFNVPVVLDTKLPDGSIRQATAELNIPLLVYEGGEALRFNELSIRVGLRGILNVLYTLKMIPYVPFKQKKIKARISRYSTWSRAAKGGIFHPLRPLGENVEKGEKLGIICDPFAKKETEVEAPTSGIIIGRNTLPLINEGDALFHIAKLKGREEAVSQLNQLQNDIINNLYYHF